MKQIFQICYKIIVSSNYDRPYYYVILLWLILLI